MAIESLLYVPENFYHPGVHLKEFIESQGMTQADFALRAGVSEKHVSQIISGKAGISEQMALLIERVVGGGAAMWVNLDSAWRLQEARKKLAEHDAAETEWTTQFPVRELRARGQITAARKGPQLVRDLCAFFGVAGREQWEAANPTAAAQFRQSPALRSSLFAQATYVRACTVRALSIETAPYRRERFEAAVRNIRGRLGEDPATLLRDAAPLLADAGVALVLEPGYSGAVLSGAVFWPQRTKAVLALTGRFKTADHLWFTFLHEAGHIILHRDRSVVEVEGATGDLEREADTFARQQLINPDAYRALSADGKPTLSQIQAVAATHALPPDSLIGMLQHDRIVRFEEYRELKRPVQIDFETVNREKPCPA